MLREKECKKENFYELTPSYEFRVGDKISGSYSIDFDIWKIHLIIRDLFSYHNSRKNKTEEDISKIKKELLTVEDSFLKKQSLKKELTKLQETLDKFSEEKWEHYIEKSKDLLERYKTLSSYRKPKTFHIGSNIKSYSDKDSPRQESQIRERIIIIRKYLKIVSNFIEIDVTFHPPYQIGCEECNLSLDEMIIDEDQGVYICACHNTFGRVFSNETIHADPDKVENSFRNSYDDKTNFLRRIKSYQGFYVRKIPEELISFLDEHMQSKYKHPPAEEIRHLPPDKYGHRGSEYTSVPLLIQTLHETNNSTHFQDINQICYELWGWICPSIDHLIPKIMEDYTRTQEIYKTNCPKLSSINVELRLYWHLRIAGHDCLLEDFKIPQSVESKKRNSHVFQIMCEETGLPFYPIT